MALSFRNSDGFWREALFVTGAATVAGFIAPLITGLPLAVVGPAAALFGGSVGAAWTRRGATWAKAALGIVGGSVAALGHVALATRFGLGLPGALLGGTLGGLAIGSLLASDDAADDPASLGGSTMVGAIGGAVLGMTGVVALGRVAAFAEAEQLSTLLTSGVGAGLMGLWVSAGAGLRRIESVRDPIIVRAERLMARTEDALRARVAQGINSYRAIMEACASSPFLGPVMRQDTQRHGRELTQSLLDTLENFLQMGDALNAPGLSGVGERLEDLAERTKATDDPVTLGHLARATQALRAQQHAIDELTRGRIRAEAAMDAQCALLERMRLALSRASSDDREHLALEMEAVADQVDRLSDDLDSLSAAMAEAESYSDRRLLAEVENAGRRAIDRMGAERSTLVPSDDSSENRAEQPQAEPAFASR